MKSFSPRNLKYRRAFAEARLDLEFVQQAAAQIHCKDEARLSARKPLGRASQLCKERLHSCSTSGWTITIQSPRTSEMPMNEITQTLDCPYRLNIEQVYRLNIDQAH